MVLYTNGMLVDIKILFNEHLGVTSGFPDYSFPAYLYVQSDKSKLENSSLENRMRSLTDEGCVFFLPYIPPVSVEHCNQCDSCEICNHHRKYDNVHCIGHAALFSRFIVKKECSSQIRRGQAFVVGLLVHLL